MVKLAEKMTHTKTQTGGREEYSHPQDHDGGCPRHELNPKSITLQVDRIHGVSALVRAEVSPILSYLGLLLNTVTLGHRHHIRSAWL